MILFVGGAVIFVVGFFFAAFIRTMRGRNFIRAVLFFPFIASPIALSIVWGVLFQYRGIVNTLLGNVGIDRSSGCRASTSSRWRWRAPSG